MCSTAGQEGSEAQGGFPGRRGQTLKVGSGVSRGQRPRVVFGVTGHICQAQLPCSIVHLQLAALIKYSISRAKNLHSGLNCCRC